jgi:hypothetical protein
VSDALFLLEFDSSLERNSSWRTVAADTNAKQACWWRDSALQSAEPSGNGNARHAGLDRARKSEVGVIESVKELRVDTGRSR